MLSRKEKQQEDTTFTNLIYLYLCVNFNLIVNNHYEVFQSRKLVPFYFDSSIFYGVLEKNFVHI